jgi:hypothetical protein
VDAKIISKPMRTARVAIAVLLLSALASAAEKTATVKFTVLQELDGKPIRAASVIIHPLDKKGNQKSEGQQIKTSSEGITEHPALPFGKVRVQVIARGFQTYGGDYDIEKEQMEIVIKLKRPQEQHSIYK